MKNWIMAGMVTLMTLPVLGQTTRPATQATTQPVEKLKGTISISGAWALYPMMVKWQEEFKKIQPDVRIDISAGGAGKGMADALAGVVDLGMVSREIHSEEVKKGALGLSVVKDAVVPVMNEKNPELATVLERGLTKEVFQQIWIDEKIETWGQALASKSEHRINVYTRSDACGAAETWANYLGKHQEDLGGNGIFGDPGIGEAVKKDPVGIGYNNVNFAYDGKTKKPIAGLKIVPIDVNGNGKIDKEENFYDTRDDLTKAIAEGRYPSPPARDLYVVSKGKPAKKEVAAFLKWILTDGQKYVEDAGYIKVDAKKIKEDLKKLD
jgi:phosphate transport system substrate-binding protein